MDPRSESRLMRQIYGGDWNQTPFCTAQRVSVLHPNPGLACSPTLLCSTPDHPNPPLLTQFLTQLLSPLISQVPRKCSLWGTSLGIHAFVLLIHRLFLVKENNHRQVTAGCYFYISFCDWRKPTSQITKITITTVTNLGSWTPFNQQQLRRGQMRNSGKALLGLVLQHGGAKTSNRYPCLFPEVGGVGRWAGSLIGVRGRGRSVA